MAVKKSDIVLGTVNAKWIHPSLALRLLKANLGDLESRCSILEFALRQPLAEKTLPLLAELNASNDSPRPEGALWRGMNPRANPKILGLSVSVWNHEATLELLETLEKVWQTLPVIILGGPELNGLPEDTDIFRFADFVIRGEGEEVFAELCRSILDELKDKRSTVKTKARFGKFIDTNPVDLTAIKPGYSLYTEEDLQRKLIYVEASRGCPFSCAFCQSAAENAGIREFPLEEFLANLDTLLQRCTGAEGAVTKTKLQTIKFLDRSFNANVPRALAILEFCLSKTTQTQQDGRKFQFHFEMVPAVCPQELRNILARFPPETLRLETGIQSFNPHTCALINRISNPERELEILRFLRTKTNAIIHADLIAGLPGEDPASFGAGFDRLWIALSGSENGVPFEIQLGILKCLPGTPVRTMADAGSFVIKYNKAAPYEVTETDCFPQDDMEKIKNFARFWELIVNRKILPSGTPNSPMGILPGKPVFCRFMELSQKLYRHFGRNWGIPKNELVEAYCKIQMS
jgi:radical SAM superfamily enzyme YgiQ (UPF0313 family)